MAERPSDAVQAEDQYRRGLAELDRYLFDFESGSLAHAVEAFRLATDHGSHTSSYWVGLGFALDASDSPREALTAFERAYALDPEDEEVEVFVLTLLSELGPEKEALAAVEARAERTGVDLESLRSELAEAEMVCDARTLVMNAFIRARNFVRSRLEDEIERLRRAQDPDDWARQGDADEQNCVQLQAELESSMDAECVPEGFREVTPWAVRLGVGDDVCRSTLVENLTASERSEVLGVIGDHATSIHRWLDGFEDRPLTPEAGAFMYLLLGLEETDDAPE